MRTKVIQINVSCPPPLLFIGRQGENGATIFEIDLSDYVTQYGAGSADILIQRDGDATPFASVTTLTDNVLSWPITNLETAVVGTGNAQLVYTVGGVIAKTQVFPFSVSKSLGDAGEPPEPWESWIDDVLEAAGEARISAGEAAKSAEDAQEAQTAAESAQAGAEAAEQEAVAAQTAAETAQGKAVDAQEAAEAAQDAAEQAAVNAGYMFFHIDENGHLIYERTSNTQVDFFLSNGHLYVEAIA
jgi:hypothetical protein